MDYLGIQRSLELLTVQFLGMLYFYKATVTRTVDSLVINSCMLHISCENDLFIFTMKEHDLKIKETYQICDNTELTIL